MTTTAIPLMGSKLWRKKPDWRRRIYCCVLRVLGHWESSANGVYFQQPRLIVLGNQQPINNCIDSQEPGHMLQPTVLSFFSGPCCTGGENLCARGSLFGEWRILFAKLYSGTLI